MAAYYLCAYGHVMRISDRGVTPEQAARDAFGVSDRVTTREVNGRGWKYLSQKEKTVEILALARDHKMKTGAVLSGCEKWCATYPGPVKSAWGWLKLQDGREVSLDGDTFCITEVHGTIGVDMSLPIAKLTNFLKGNRVVSIGGEEMGNEAHNLINGERYDTVKKVNDYYGLSKM